MAMNHVAAIVIALVIIVLLIAFLAGMAAIIGAGDDLYREYDDRDQEEFIRRWMAEKRKRDARKIARRRKR
jgi:hypothetical protein